MMGHETPTLLFPELQNSDASSLSLPLDFDASPAAVALSRYVGPVPTTAWGCVLCTVHNERRGEVTHRGRLGTRCPEREHETKAWCVQPPKARMGLDRLQLEPDLSRMPRRDQVPS